MYFREFCTNNNILLQSAPVVRYPATGLANDILKLSENALGNIRFNCQGRPSKPLSLELYIVFVQSKNNSPFEAYFGHKPNTVWHRIAKAATVKNLSLSTVLCFLNKNNKIFPAQVMQNYALPDNDSIMRTYANRAPIGNSGR